MRGLDGRGGLLVFGARGFLDQPGELAVVVVEEAEDAQGLWSG